MIRFESLSRVQTGLIVILCHIRPTWLRRSIINLLHRLGLVFVYEPESVETADMVTYDLDCRAYVIPIIRRPK